MEDGPQGLYFGILRRAMPLPGRASRSLRRAGREKPVRRKNGAPADRLQHQQVVVADVLARTPQCQDCIVKQYFRFVAGRPETNADRPLIRKVSEDFRNSKFRFKELIASMMVAREFP